MKIEETSVSVETERGRIATVWPYPRQEKLLLAWLSTVAAISAALLIFFEKVEYDTFTYYASKVDLLDAGLEGRWLQFVQEYLPIGWTKIQFLWHDSFDYARNWANFAVSALLIVVVWRTLPSLRYPLVLLLLTNEAFFVQATGYKTDGALGAFAILLILALFRLSGVIRTMSVVVIVALMLSIKWTAIALVLPIFVVSLLLWSRCFIRNLGLANKNRCESIQNFSLHAPNHAWRTTNFAFWGVVTLIVAWWLAQWLDLGTYVRSYVATGSFTPTESFGVNALNPSVSNLVFGIGKYTTTAIIESFEPLFSWMIVRGIDLSLLSDLTLQNKMYIKMGPDQIFTFANANLVLGLIASGVYLFRGPGFVRVASWTALSATLLSLTAYPLTFGGMRYFTPFVMVSYVPLAAGIAAAANYAIQAKNKWAGLLFRSLSIVALTATVLANAYYLALDWHRNLVPSLSAAPLAPIDSSSSPSTLDPIWIDYGQRANWRWFRGWSGYQTVFDALERENWTDSPVTIVTASNQNLANYSHPFLRTLSRASSDYSIVDLDETGSFGDGCLVDAGSVVLAFSPKAVSGMVSLGMQPIEIYPDQTIGAFRATRVRSIC